MPHMRIRGRVVGLLGCVLRLTQAKTPRRSRDPVRTDVSGSGETSAAKSARALSSLPLPPGMDFLCWLLAGITVSRIGDSLKGTTDVIHTTRSSV